MQDLVELCTTEMRSSRAYTHPFLAELGSGAVDIKGAEQFAMQWYKAAAAHKKSFPGLIYNISDDRIRLQLIEILRQEYGFGCEDRVHAKLLENFLSSLGLNIHYALETEAEPEIEVFSHSIDDLWVRSDPIAAFGVHFALEFLAAYIHKFFYLAVQTIPDLTADDIEYFKIHSIAEVEHCNSAEHGIRILAADPRNAERLLNGVGQGTRLIELLLDGLYRAYRRADGSSVTSSAQ